MANMQKALVNNKNVQVKYIRQGFEEIIDALARKKDSIIEQTTAKYDNELQNMKKLSKSGGRMKHINDIKNDAKALKNMSTKNKKSLISIKSKKIKDFNEQLLRTINEHKRLSRQSSKLGEIDGLSGQNQSLMGKEFTPVTIDTTSAIAYITNMTLSNQSIVGNKLEMISEKAGSDK